MRLKVSNKVFCHPGAFALACFILSGISWQLRAQEIKVRGGFLTDTVRIGEQAAYYLSATYPAQQNVIFPDSTFKFTPFEFESRRYFPTQTTNGISKDSTLYYLATFEVDSVQKLSLPVYALLKGDCTAIFSDEDQVILKETVSVPDSLSLKDLPLKSDTLYHRVEFDINVLIISIIGGVATVLLVILWIIFGKRIRRYFKAKKLQKNHTAFLVAYRKVLEELRPAFSSAKTENALVVWKRYMEQLENRPYTKLTTRDLLALQTDKNLIENLRNIDRAIYGHEHSVIDALQFLERTANENFNHKIQEVRHGK